MSDNLDLSASITTEEPEIAANLSELRYLVFQGKKGDPGEDGVSFVSAYLDDGVVRYANDYGEHDADDIYTATAMAQDIGNGVLPLVYYSPEDNVFDYFELDRHDIGGATWVVYFRSKDYLLSVDSTGAYTLTDRPQGGSGADEIAVIDIADDFSMSIGGDSVTAAEIVRLAQSGKTVIGRYDAYGDGSTIVTMHAATDEDDGGGNTGVTFTGVLFWRSAWHVCVADAGNNQSTLSAEYHQLLPAASVSDSGKVPTVNSIGGYSLQAPSGYVKPSGGIPASDLASAVQTSLGKADTALQQHQSLAGYATESYVQTQIAAIPDELPADADLDSVLVFDGEDWQAANPADFLRDNGAVVAQSATVGQIPVKTANGWAAQNIPTELPAVTASDNGKFLRVVSGAWAAATVSTWQGGSY